MQKPPLKVPAGLDTPNTAGALVIPTVELAPPPPGPHDACLDVPPRYKPAPPNKAAQPGLKRATDLLAPAASGTLAARAGCWSQRRGGRVVEGARLESE